MDTDLTIDLSEWTCDIDVCGITGPCDACQRRERVSKLLAQRDLERRPCTLDCTPSLPCDRCKEVDEYLKWLYLQRDQVAVLLRALRQVARVFPGELGELLSPSVQRHLHAFAAGLAETELRESYRSLVLDLVGDDIVELQGELKPDIEEIRAELAQQAAELAELRAELAQLRSISPL